MKTTLGQRIRQAREAAGLTQEQLGRSAGVTRSAISQWETGTVDSVEAATLNRAARALGVSIDWLLSGAPNAVGEGEPLGYLATLPPDLLELWPQLTASQQGQILDQVRALATLAAEIRRELG